MDPNNNQNPDNEEKENKEKEEENKEEGGGEENKEEEKEEEEENKEEGGGEENKEEEKEEEEDEILNTMKELIKKTGKKEKENEPKNKMFLLWIILILLEAIGLAFTIIGIWIIGLIFYILAGIFAYKEGNEIIPKITFLIIALSLNFIKIIPQSNLVSSITLTISLILIEMTIHKKKYKPLTYGGVIFLFIWNFYIFSGVSLDIKLIIESITVPLVIASIIWNRPFSLKFKFLGTLICFLPSLIIIINFAVMVVGASLGSTMDIIQNALSGGVKTSNTNTILDMILNPKLAIQAQFKPPSKKEIRETSSKPQIAYLVSGESIPKIGCYGSTTFQLFGKIKNTGTKQIVDIDISMTPKKVLNSPCNNIDTSKCNWKITSIPVGVTASRNCMIDAVPAGKLSTQSHSCYVIITAKTGYHSISRLPVSLIQKSYAISKFEQKQLTMGVIPSTTSIGPVELSLGGFEQPIIVSENPDTFVLRISVSNTGNGDVGEYKSAYIYVPNSLLNEDGQCYNSDSADLICLNKINNDDDCNKLIEPAKSYCENFNDFKNENKIGGFKQVNYDNSDELLNNGYSICFLKKTSNELKNYNLATCNLKASPDLMKSYDLRKTLIIRGDVLYTYNVTGETSIMLQQCSI